MDYFSLSSLPKGLEESQILSGPCSDDCEVDVFSVSVLEGSVIQLVQFSPFLLNQVGASGLHDSGHYGFLPQFASLVVLVGLLSG